MRTIADMQTALGAPEHWPEAVYLEQEVAAYRNNPFIEALPPIADDVEATDAMQVIVRATEADRALPSHIRRHLVASIGTFHQPFDAHIELYHTINVMIRQGYIARNPLNRGFVCEMESRLAALEHAAKAGQLPSVLKMGLYAAQSASLLGLSGVGKTQAANGVLRAIGPQVVLHPQLSMGPLGMVQQLRYLKVTCPEGSVKTLCIACIQEVDRVLGTNYARLHCTRAATADTLRVALARLAWLHGLGLLVIDEVQHLRFAKGNAAENMKNYFKILADVMMVPVLVVGTLDASRVLGGDFQSGRRHAGIPHMLPLPLYEPEQVSADVAGEASVADGGPDGSRAEPGAIGSDTAEFSTAEPTAAPRINAYFRFICEGLFGAQFLREPIEPDDSLLIVLHDLSQGILGVLVKLFILTQYRALSAGIERLSAELFIEVYEDSFSLLHRYLQQMRSGEVTDQEMFGAALEEFDREFETARAAVGQPSVAGLPTPGMITPMPEAATSAPVPEPVPEARAAERKRKTGVKRRSKGARSECLLVRTVEDGLAHGVSPHEALLAAGFVRSIGLEAEVA